MGKNPPGSVGFSQSAINPLAIVAPQGFPTQPQVLAPPDPERQKEAADPF